MKNKLFIKALILGFLVTCLGCQKDDDKLVEENFLKEEIILNYGVSKDILLSSKTYRNVDIELNTLKNTSIYTRNESLASQLTSEELLDRLDFDNAFYSSDSVVEVLNAPVKSLGSYKRELLSLTKNDVTQSFLVTYPDSTNLREFYMTTLGGILIQKVNIQDDGYGLIEKYNVLPSNSDNGDSNTASRVGTCSDTIFNTCSSGNHSFENGTAGDCTYWSNPGGNPPSVFTTEYPCNDVENNNTGTNTSGSSGSGSNTGGGFSNAPTRGGGGGPTGLSNEECVENLDCEDCNLPGDLDNSCDLSPYEVIVMTALASDPELEYNDIAHIINGMDNDCQALILFRSILRPSPTTFLNLIKDRFVKPDDKDINFQDLAEGEGNPAMPANAGARTNPYRGTNPQTGADVMIIEFNETHLNTATDLGMVITLYHELLHAYIYDLYHEGELLTTYPQYTDLNTALNNYFNDDDNVVLGEIKEQEMHNIYVNFIDMLADSVLKYAIANNIDIDLNYAKDLVWGSLNGYDVFEDNLTQSQQNTAQARLAYENQNTNNYAKGSKDCD